ncbi:hypothetical protein KKI24_09040 [bacterium]|nr:hypothetical protein [bacterium]
MLRITVEKLPCGREEKAEKLDSFTIWNQENGKDLEHANYIVNHVGGSFEIRDHKKADGFWPLVHRALHGYICLEEIKEEENKWSKITTQSCPPNAEK